MKHITLVSALAAVTMLALSCQCDHGMKQDLDALYQNDIPFDMPAYRLPQIPMYTVELPDFGGVADGVTDNTQAFAKAIADLDVHGGGTLVVPAGIWCTGPIEFVSHMCLNVQKGAVILFSDDHSLYPLIKGTYEGLDAVRCLSPLNAVNLTDVAIVGEGVLDGRGDSWRPVKRGKMTNAQWQALLDKGGFLNPKGDIWFPTESGRDGYCDGQARQDPERVHDFYRPVMLSFRHCRNVLLRGVSFQNSPAWCLHPYCCENVVIYNVSVRNPWYSQNGDGLDLESCTNTIVHKCRFDVGDDAICIKSGKNEEGRRRGMPTQDALIVGNTVYHGHGGFVVGSEMSGGARRLYVKDCDFLGTDVGLRFKSTRGRGGVVEDIYIDGIRMVDIATEALRFNLYYEGKSPVPEEGDNPSAPLIETRPVDEGTPVFRNIYIRHVTCTGAGSAMLFNGLPEMPITGIYLKDCELRADKKGVLAQVDGLEMENVQLYSSDDKPLYQFNTANITIR